MDDTQSIDQIRECYPDQWVLIAYTELDAHSGVLRGRVVEHSTDRDRIYQALMVSRSPALAVEYTGTIPQDLAVLL